jgi:hypothetical protein
VPFAIGEPPDHDNARPLPGKVVSRLSICERIQINPTVDSGVLLSLPDPSRQIVVGDNVCVRDDPVRIARSLSLTREYKSIQEGVTVIRERHAVYRVYDGRHLRERCGEPSNDAGFRGMRMDNIVVLLPEISSQR